MLDNKTATVAMRRPTDQAAVAMGQAVVAAEPVRLTAILGSCIAVVLYSRELRLGMLSHVVLPHSTGPTAYPAKFADTAVPYMLSVLQSRGAKPQGLVAKITGGACMFGNCKVMQIGDANIRAAVEALSAAGIRIVGQDVGGTVGRRIGFEPADGSLTVECIGHPSHTI
jgi:chemotaxis protein CheD